MSDLDRSGYDKPLQEWFAAESSGWEFKIMSDEFPRWRELANYAMHHDISINKAIVRLVNSGLSHESRTYL